MVTDRAIVAAVRGARAQAVGRPAGGPEREPLYGAVGQPLADAAEGFPTLADVGSSLAFSGVMMVRSSRPGVAEAPTARRPDGGQGRQDRRRPVPQLLPGLSLH